MDYDFGEDIDLTVTLELEDGTSLDCDVLTIFELDGQDYVALYPTDGKPDEVYLYRCEYDGGLDMEISEIEDEDEYNDVAETFDTIMEEHEWNDLMEDYD